MNSQKILILIVLIINISVVQSHFDYLIYGNQCHSIIRNGGFQQNRCGAGFCVYNQTKNYDNQVADWIPNPQIQVGFHKTYLISAKNKDHGRWVVDLQPRKNSCIMQYIRTYPGTYSLQFDYAMNHFGVAGSSSFYVSINDQIIQSFIPTSKTMKTQKFQLDIYYYQSKIQFCSTGTQDTFGALIDNVKLFHIDFCDHSKV